MDPVGEPTLFRSNEGEASEASWTEREPGAERKMRRPWLGDRGSGGGGEEESLSRGSRPSGFRRGQESRRVWTGRGVEHARDASPAGSLRPLWDSREELREVPGAGFGELARSPGSRSLRGV
ncbi:hypothetical protein J1605_021156 [Eschrichtius robustus]|uniref:Uncharacterized protein n=1 Tax=Eschrichtius robustus TaxID=9764 RepID=A0AB34HER0_ESCRO|nr:hypothetical protein J1605_021156 [Eschrichtius robustus]